MKLRNILALALALVLAISLCACGGNDTAPETTEGTTAPNNTVETTEETVDDGKVTYTVTVLDEAGNPIAGAFVQLCLESCIPSATNAEGKAIYNVEQADYKVSFLSMPAGYTCDEEAFYFDGEFDLTITLKAAG